MPTNLQSAILNDKTVSVNFFNGRILSGDDMAAEQAGNRTAHALLGLGLGDGVAYGLEVSEALGVSSAAAPVLAINRGLAINRKGQTLLLADDTQLSLVPPVNAATAPAKLFSDCAPPTSGVYVAASGVYILVISPALGGKGLAQVSGLGNVVAPCNTKYNVDAVQFRLIQLDMSPAELADGNKIRNIVAYKCFGTAAYTAEVTNPFAAGSTIPLSALDALRPASLTDCDVPLCALYWTASGGLQFIDIWSARRPLTKRHVSESLPFAVNDETETGATAMLLQFQDQMRSILNRSGSPQSIPATTYFRLLPPAGVIPVFSVASPLGFDYPQFFAGLPYRGPLFVEGTRVEPILRQTLRFQPIDLSSGELIWLYRVRQNMQAIAAGGASQPQPYLIFVTGHAPCFGDAHYQVNRWDYSTYL